MKFKWLFLSILSLLLVCIFGFRLDSEQLRSSLMTAIRGGHAEAATIPEKTGSVSDQSLASLPMSISVDNSNAAKNLNKISFASEILRSSLLKAVRTDNAELTRKLIKLGADANSRTSTNGWSVLHYAVRNGDAELVQLLLKAGADPNCLGTMEGQKETPVSVRPLVLAQAALDLVSQVPAENMEATLRQSGLDEPALMKSMKDPNATDRYRKVIDVLAGATKKS